MSDVINLLQEEYGFHVFDQREVGGRTILETDKGLYNLYIYPEGYRAKKKLVEQVKKHLTKQTDFSLLPVEKTKNNQSYLTVGDKMLYVQRGIREGHTADYAQATGESLAQFHKSTSTLTGDAVYYPFRSQGSWPSMWRKKINSFESMRENLERETREFTAFDEYLLTTYTYAHHMGDTAVQYLQANGYQQVVKLTAGFGKIAFQNFDDGFLLFHENGSRKLAGEYSWVLDMRSRDIGQWIKGEIRRNGYNPAVICRFLDGYNHTEPLLNEEYAVIFSLLMYPGRFFRQVEMYDRMDRASFETMELQEWTQDLDQELLAMEDAMRKFPALVKEAYGFVLPQVDWLSREHSALAGST
ncbi:hypothetical protein ACQCN2_19125 [Brevibacillus ginsengisoli]|uniref:hypothetical protein n=1 Tax=Brevibacillus ginsengisoli TaxID=363854 RepID=UPI003CEFFEE7